MRKIIFGCLLSLGLFANESVQNENKYSFMGDLLNEVKSTIKNIQEASAPLEKGELEFFSYHINEALENISNITRPYEHDQMLDVMFGSFCLGK